MIFFFIITFPLYADIVYLKDGKILKGRIARQTLTKVELVTENKTIIIDKNDVIKIRYITEEELKKQQQKKLEELRKKQEELKRIEEEKLKKQEEEKKLEEQRKLLEEQKKLEELKKLEEEQKRKQEEWEEFQRLEEIRKKEEEKLKLEIQQQEPLETVNKIQFHIGIGVGSFNIPLNSFYNYSNIYSSYLQNQEAKYIQNFQISTKTIPDWNWSGNLHAGLSYIYKDWEYGFIIYGIFQKIDPKINSLPIKYNSTISNTPQYPSFSEDRFLQKKYQNNIYYFFVKVDTEKYLSFFWNYIFPYFEIGYLYRNLNYFSKSNASLLTSSYNGLLNQYEVSNYLATEVNLKNSFKMDGFSLKIPFRFLMIFDSEFLFEFEYLFYGKSELKQQIKEFNNLNTNITNFVVTDSNLTGKFYSNRITFRWQNTFYSSMNLKSIAYLQLSKAEYMSLFTNMNVLSSIFLPEIKVFIYNDFLLSPYQILYSNLNFKRIKEKSFFFEFGYKLQTSL